MSEEVNLTYGKFFHEKMIGRIVASNQVMKKIDMFKK